MSSSTCRLANSASPDNRAALAQNHQTLCPPPVPLTATVHLRGLELAQEHEYHFYDAMMLAPALERAVRCSTPRNCRTATNRRTDDSKSVLPVTRRMWTLPPDQKVHRLGTSRALGMTRRQRRVERSQPQRGPHVEQDTLGRYLPFCEAPGARLIYRETGPSK